MVVVGLHAFLPSASYAQVFVAGDLNNDGFFNVVDSTVLRRALVPLPPGISQGCVLVPGDVNSDSVFNSADSTVVRNLLAGLGPGISQTGDPLDADCDDYEVGDGDCNDLNHLVNPGAYDYPGNGIDDDCVGGDASERVICDLGLASNDSSPVNYARSLDLCSTTIESPPQNQRTWGVISGAFTQASGAATPNALGRSIRSVFGTNNPTRFGNAMTVLSTGNAAAPLDMNPGHVAFQTGASFLNSSVLPTDWLAAHGGTPPSAPGCPAPATDVPGEFQAKDSIMLKLRIRVPTNAQSFKLAAKHFNADYPEFVCSAYNDYFVVLLDSLFLGAPANPADKNLAAVANFAGQYPVGANLATGTWTSGLVVDCLNGPTGCTDGAVAGTYNACTGTSGLAGTGMDVLNPPNLPGFAGWCDSSNLTGAGTAWLSVAGNVVPGEVIEIHIAIWDTYDENYDSLVLLDDFQWSPTTITPGAIAN